ncbi:MAG: hypothetical protein ACI8R4_001698 [Paracoccaceae bacterium]|jgi:hypothetical protein
MVFRTQLIHLNRIWNILDQMGAAICKRYRQTLVNLFKHRTGHCHTTRRGQGLCPGGNIDPVAINVIVLDNNLAQVDPDAQVDPILSRLPGHGVLNFYRALDSGCNTCEFNKRTIPHQLDQTPVMAANRRFNKGATRIKYPCQRGRFVLGHHPAEANHIPHHNGRKPSVFDRSHIVLSLTLRVSLAKQ